MFAGKNTKGKTDKDLEYNLMHDVTPPGPILWSVHTVTLNENMNRPGRNDGIFAAETILKRRVRDVSNNSDGCLLCWQGLMVIRCLVLFYFAGQSRVFHEVEWIFCQVSCVVL